MSYQSWSVVFGEQPSAAKWNILGTNDSSFNDGTGIGNLEIGSGHTSVKNDYKFSVYRNAAQNTGSIAFSIVLCDTKLYDTGSNVDVVTNKGRFTAPVTGFYHFEGGFSATGIGTGGGIIAALYKNGTEFTRGNRCVSNQNTLALGVTVSDTISLSATDYVELAAEGTTGAQAMEVGASAPHPYFTGFLVSQT